MTFFKTDEQLKTLGTSIIEATRREFAQLNPEQLALTWIVYERSPTSETGSNLIRGMSDRATNPFTPPVSSNSFT
jgi:hypothetical protein